MTDECIFCRIVKQNSEKFINENDDFIAVLDIAPQIEGHTLIIPRKHFTTILDLPSDFGLSFLKFVKETSEILMNKYNSDGFNLAVNTNRSAGQIVDHFHMHIFPRRKNDGYHLSIREK